MAPRKFYFRAMLGVVHFLSSMSPPSLTCISFLHTTLHPFSRLMAATLCTSSTVDRVFEEVTKHSADHNMEKALNQLDLRLTTPLVTDVLRRLNYKEKLAFRFFIWASHHQNYVHEPDAYNVIIDILSYSEYRIKQFRIVCDLLDYMKRSSRPYVPPEVLVTALGRYAEKHLPPLYRVSGRRRIRAKVHPKVQALNLLLDVFCKCSLVVEAEAILKRVKSMIIPIGSTYNILFFGWCQVGDPRRGMKMVEKMVGMGQIPDSMTYNTAIEAFCKANMVNDAIELFENIKARGLSTSMTYVVMIGTFAREDRMEDCFRFFGDMITAGCVPDVKMYKGLIGEMCLAGKIKEAYRFLEEMGRKGYPCDVVTYNCFLDVICENRMTEESLWFYRRMIEVGCAPSVHTFNSLISMFFEMGEVDGAFDAWNELKNSGCVGDLKTHCLMIEGLFNLNREEEACYLLDNVVKKGMKLPYCKFDGFLKRLSAIGDLKSIHRLSTHMRKFYNPIMEKKFARQQKLASMKLRSS